MNTKPIILFLDFDGVLHPVLSPVGRYFSKLKVFEECILGHSNVTIVISSNWRYQYTMDELLNFFSNDVQRMVIDCTRDKSESNAQNRYEEIMDYLNFTNQSNVTWIAIDDSVAEFPSGLSNILFCSPNVGFDEHAANQLRSMIEAI